MPAAPWAREHFRCGGQGPPSLSRAYVGKLLATLAVRGDTLLIALSGDLDLAAAEHVEDHFSTAISLAEHRVIVDLALVDFFDSAGLHVLHRARSEALRSGVAFACAAPSSQVARLLTTLTGRDRPMPVFGSVAKALHRVQARLLVGGKG